MEFLIVCKGGVNTGLGHLHRTISFTSSASKYANFTTIAIIEHGLENIFSKLDDTYFIYDESELITTISNIKSTIQNCILDCVELKESSSIFLKTRFKSITSLSPIFNNYNLLDFLFTRFKDAHYPSNVKVFSGLEYTVFSNNCTEINDQDYLKHIYEDNLTIAISMGGTDAPNKTLKILESIANLNCSLSIWVLLGEGYVHSYQALVDSINNNSSHEIILVKSNKSMWKILSNCSLAILAGGITSFEAIYAGLPSINIFEKEIHQQIISEEFLNLNANINLSVLSPPTLSDLNNKIIFFYNNRNALLEIRNNCKSKLDKNGSARIICKLLELLS